jgi:Zn-finger protein
MDLYGAGSLREDKKDVAVFLEQGDHYPCHDRFRAFYFACPMGSYPLLDIGKHAPIQPQEGREINST